MKPVTSEQMSEIDRKAREVYGIPQKVLMEKAGSVVAEVVISEAYPLKNKNIAVFCGKGNNGGDGFVAARYLFAEKPGGLVVFIPDMGTIRAGAPCDNFKTIRGMGLEIRTIENYVGEKDEGNFSIVLDAMFGTGFKGALTGGYSKAADRINRSGARVFAVDVPSGLDATTGKAAGNCVKADMTITFGLPKTGFYLADGPEVCGNIIVKDIGFPVDLVKPYF